MEVDVRMANAALKALAEGQDTGEEEIPEQLREAFAAVRQLRHNYDELYRSAELWGSMPQQLEHNHALEHLEGLKSAYLSGRYDRILQLLPRVVGTALLRVRAEVEDITKRRTP